ncbi:Nn.00g026660.m01.CDS01 [Neocucurbitaria sp. VM-36]
MANDTDGGLHSGNSMHPSRDEREPSLTSSETVTDGDTSDYGVDDKEDLKTELKLWLAERENDDLKRKLREAQRKANYVRTEMQAMKDTNELLTAELGTLRLEIDEANFHAMDTNNLRALVAELQATHAAHENKVEQLTNKNDQLATQHLAAREAINQNEADLSFYRAECEDQGHDLIMLQEKLAAAETDRDWHRSEHTKILEVRNDLNAARAHDSRKVDRLKDDITKLRNGKQELEKSINSLKLDIAFYITQMDLVGCRVFTCKHNDLSSVPDGQNSTRENAVWHIASEFFRDWENDNEFIEEYNGVRGYFLDHHRAHERVNQGRGDFSGQLHHRFLDLDGRRGVRVTYV